MGTAWGEHNGGGDRLGEHNGGGDRLARSCGWGAAVRGDARGVGRSHRPQRPVSPGAGGRPLIHSPVSSAGEGHPVVGRAGAAGFACALRRTASRDLSSRPCSAPSRWPRRCACGTGGRDAARPARRRAVDRDTDPHLPRPGGLREQPALRRALQPQHRLGVDGGRRPHLGPVGPGRTHLRPVHGHGVVLLPLLPVVGPRDVLAVPPARRDPAGCRRARGALLRRSRSPGTLRAPLPRGLLGRAVCRSRHHRDRAGSQRAGPGNAGSRRAAGRREAPRLRCGRDARAPRSR